jgi:predicted ArsR family transcriptional regulator
VIDNVGELKKLVTKKEELGLIAKSELSQLFIEKCGSAAEEIIDRYQKMGAKKWGMEEAKKRMLEGKEIDIEGLLLFLWKPLLKEGFEFTYELISKTCQMNVTHCPIAEIAKKNHIEKWGYKFHCMSDESICEGYNPKLKMKRTKTIMEGSEKCNHFYYFED